MILKENLHTHTIYCDGNDTIDEIIETAISKGFNTIGFSGHSYTSFDESYCMSKENTKKYIAQIKNAKEKYKDKINILCGIEQDYYGSLPTIDYDYVIGSVHGFFMECDSEKIALIKSALSENPNLVGGLILGKYNEKEGVYIYVDFNRDTLKWAIDNLYDGDSLSLASDYYNVVGDIYNKTKCRIIGHFDLLTKYDEIPGVAPLFNQNATEYQKAVNRALNSLLTSDVIFEINTGAMAKGYRTVPYPSEDILKKIRKSGGKVTISSDCHNRDQLDFGFEKALELARKCGFSKIETII